MATNSRIGPVERATDRTWDQWLQVMTAIGAEDLDPQADRAGGPRDRDRTPST